MTNFIQMTVRKFEDNRRLYGSEPVFQFNLQDHEQIVGVKHYGSTKYDNNERKTVDHWIEVWVAVNCEPIPEAENV